MIQTLRRTDAGHIAYTVTIDDPKAYTKPWKNERTFTLMDTELIEYSCEENNRGLRERPHQAVDAAREVSVQVEKFKVQSGEVKSRSSLLHFRLLLT